MRRKPLQILLILMVCALVLPLLTQCGRNTAAAPSEAFTAPTEAPEATEPPEKIEETTPSPVPETDDTDDFSEMEIVDEVVVEIEEGQAIIGG